MPTANNKQRTRDLSLGFIVLFILTNIGLALSIDRGSIIVYILTGLLIYLTIRCGIQLIKHVFHYYDKTSRTGRAKKAH